MTKIAVVGSRSINDTSIVKQALVACPFLSDDTGVWWADGTLVSGGADGVDSCVEEIAEQYDITIDVIEPDWDDWSRGMPTLARNTDIVEQSDKIVAVWDGHSNGTRDTIDKALDEGKSIYVHVVQ